MSVRMSVSKCHNIIWIVINLLLYCIYPVTSLCLFRDMLIVRGSELALYAVVIILTITGNTDQTYTLPVIGMILPLTDIITLVIKGSTFHQILLYVASCTLLLASSTIWLLSRTGSETSVLPVQMIGNDKETICKTDDKYIEKTLPKIKTNTGYSVLEVDLINKLTTI
ncbi:hypothetical protein LSH36_225g00011 [Paralvinella palmiformis]|uniref:Uncharacterized protein n=1 Tax=Paralvinella palmiformis TaxID=53620 RepID=A0AAD9JP20_9ANNE|nr:hypothetical protein LSH36_225g00011 [Paralvinella palmiformis]